MNNRKRSIALYMLAAALFALSACTTPADLAPAPTATPAADEVESDSAPAEEPQEQAQAAETPLPRVPRQALEATDPSTVVLASGQPQLVEFFAFW
jgi:hypothetical protein